MIQDSSCEEKKCEIDGSAFEEGSEEEGRRRMRKNGIWQKAIMTKESSNDACTHMKRMMERKTRKKQSTFILSLPCALLLFLTTKILIHTVLFTTPPHVPCSGRHSCNMGSGRMEYYCCPLLFSSHVYHHLGLNLLESQRIHTTFIMHMHSA